MYLIPFSKWVLCLKTSPGGETCGNLGGTAGHSMFQGGKVEGQVLALPSEV